MRSLLFILVVLVLIFGCKTGTRWKCFDAGEVIYQGETEGPWDSALCPEERGARWYWHQDTGKFQADRCSCEMYGE